VAQCKLTLACIATSIAAASPAVAAKFETLYHFQGERDGSTPFGELLAVGQMLYGTTSDGGPTHDGTVFIFDPKSGVKTILYNMRGRVVGDFPDAPLLLHHGALVTTNVEGGSPSCVFGCGTAFTVNIKTGAAALLYGFPDPLAGETPTGGLTYWHGGYYGTTYYGGGADCYEQLGCGIVYRSTRRPTPKQSSTISITGTKAPGRILASR